MSLVGARRFRDPWEASLAQSRLESAGIGSILLDHYTVSQNWLYSQALGGVRLCVEESDLQAATELLGPPSGDAAPRGGDFGKAAVVSFFVLGPVTLLLALAALVARLRGPEGIDGPHEAA